MPLGKGKRFSTMFSIVFSIVSIFKKPVSIVLLLEVDSKSAYFIFMVSVLPLRLYFWVRVNKSFESLNSSLGHL